MRDMFDSYSNLSDIYVPDNTTPTLNTFVLFDNNAVKKEYNIKREFIGYSWGYGDTPTIEIALSKKIRVEEDAIVFYNSEEEPSSSTVGIKGQRAYNAVDIKSWTCTTLDTTNYVWVEDSTFKYPENGTKEISLKTFPDIENKTVNFTIKNFRKEVVYNEKFSAVSPFFIHITKEISDKLLQGVYTCYVELYDETSYISCMKFTIIIKDSCSYENSFVSIVGE